MRVNPETLLYLKLRKTCKEAIEFYGIDSQLDKTLEELDELLEEVSQAKIDNVNLTGLAEEIADVYIMINQLSIYYGIGSRVNNYIDLKIHKLQQRMEREEE